MEKEQQTTTTAAPVKQEDVASKLAVEPCGDTAPTESSPMIFNHVPEDKLDGLIQAIGTIKNLTTLSIGPMQGDFEELDEEDVECLKQTLADNSFVTTLTVNSRVTARHVEQICDMIVQEGSLDDLNTLKFPNCNTGIAIATPITRLMHHAATKKPNSKPEESDDEDEELVPQADAQPQKEQSTPASTPVPATDSTSALEKPDTTAEKPAKPTDSDSKPDTPTVEQKPILSLDLTGNGLGPEGAAKLTEAATKADNVDVLLLRDNNIGKNGWLAVAEYLSSTQELETLDISRIMTAPSVHCSFPVSTAAVADALTKNQSLTHLDLSFSNLGTNGWEALAKALKQNSTLKSIKLGNCFAGPAGGDAIAGALAENKSLTSINLSLNRLGKEGGLAVMKALKTNDTLESLNISHNSIPEEVFVELVRVLKEDNQTINTINFLDLKRPPALAIDPELANKCSPSVANLIRNELCQNLTRLTLSNFPPSTGQFALPRMPRQQLSIQPSERFLISQQSARQQAQQGRTPQPQPVPAAGAVAPQQRRTTNMRNANGRPPVPSTMPSASVVPMNRRVIPPMVGPGGFTNAEMEVQRLKSEIAKFKRDTAQLLEDPSSDFSWSSFLRSCGIPDNYAETYEVLFLDEQIEEDQIRDLTMEILGAIGIKLMGHKMKIMKVVNRGGY
mmetsp:Transcript_11144/g.12265  ORF Transcript_11144/g.12265 Transcript_11144/m.12265 type:complete len:675 (+) Transcript_11144:32-2056(+)